MFKFDFFLWFLYTTLALVSLFYFQLKLTQDLLDSEVRIPIYRRPIGSQQLTVPDNMNNSRLKDGKLRVGSQCIEPTDCADQGYIACQKLNFTVSLHRNEDDSQTTPQRLLPGHKYCLPTETRSNSCSTDRGGSWTIFYNRLMNRYETHCLCRSPHIYNNTNGYGDCDTLTACLRQETPLAAIRDIVCICEYDARPLTFAEGGPGCKRKTFLQAEPRRYGKFPFAKIAHHMLDEGFLAAFYEDTALASRSFYNPCRMDAHTGQIVNDCEARVSAPTNAVYCYCPPGSPNKAIRFHTDFLRNNNGRLPNAVMRLGAAEHFGVQVISAGGGGGGGGGQIFANDAPIVYETLHLINMPAALMRVMNTTFPGSVLFRLFEYESRRDALKGEFQVLAPIPQVIFWRHDILVWGTRKVKLWLMRAGNVAMYVPVSELLNCHPFVVMRPYTAIKKAPYVEESKPLLVWEDEEFYAWSPDALHRRIENEAEAKLKQLFRPQLSSNLSDFVRDNTSPAFHILGNPLSGWYFRLNPKYIGPPVFHYMLTNWNGAARLSRDVNFAVPVYEPKTLGALNHRGVIYRDPAPDEELLHVRALLLDPVQRQFNVCDITPEVPGPQPFYPDSSINSIAWYRHQFNVGSKENTLFYSYFHSLGLQYSDLLNYIPDDMKTRTTTLNLQ